MNKNHTHPIFLLFLLIFYSYGELPAQIEQGNHVQYISMWGEEGSDLGQFHEPHSLSVDPSGYLYVADTENHRIQKLDHQGIFLSEKGAFGWESEEFDRPVAVSSQNGLDVYVADYNNQRIVRYDKDLHYLSSLTSDEEWSENLQFGYPMGVDLSTHGELFCLDTENNRVLKFDVLGNPQISFGDFDAGEGRLTDPQRITVTPSGRVFVSDTDPGRIVVFDIHGNFLFSFGEGILKHPVGISTIEPGLLMICDTEAKKVFLFREEGGPLGSIEGSMKGIKFEEPIDAAYWKQNIYILDKKNAVIFVFKWFNNGGIISE